MAHSKSEIKKAKNLLNKFAPTGEQLAYINSKEARLLKSRGGAGKDVNVSGIKSYYYDAAGVDGATSGGSRDSGGYGGGNDSDDDAVQSKPQKSMLSRVGGFIRDAALTIATGGAFGLSKIGAIAAVKGAKTVTRMVRKNIGGTIRTVVAGPGDSYPLTNKDFGKKTTTVVNNGGGGGGGGNEMATTQVAKNLGGKIIKSPTTAEVSQSSATDVTYDARKTKARGRSLTIRTNSRGVGNNMASVLGKKSLLGAA